MIAFKFVSVDVVNNIKTKEKIVLSVRGARKRVCC